MNVFNKLIITNATMNTTLTSEAIPLVNTYGYSIQAKWTGTPTGTLKLQASSDAFMYVNDNQPQVPTTWTDIADSSQSIVAAGDFMWNIIGAFYNFVRVVYTDGSGGSSTAVINVRINAKG